MSMVDDKTYYVFQNNCDGMVANMEDMVGIKMWFKTSMDPNQTRPDNNKPLLMIIEGNRDVVSHFGIGEI
jgi:hypothetical protein